MFSKYFKPLLKIDLLLPLGLILGYIILAIIIKGAVPTSDELISSFGNLYKKYGYEIIFVAALLENLVLVNFLVPGVLAMALGAIFAALGLTDLRLVIVFASLGSIAANALDYALGYYGLSDFIEKYGYSKFVNLAKGQLNRFGKKALAIAFIYPATASFMSVSAGVIKYKPKEYFLTMIPSIIVAMIGWGVAFYIFGHFLLVLITRYSFLVLIFMVAGFIAMSFIKKD